MMVLQSTGGVDVKTRLAADRLTEKTSSMHLTNYLRYRYNFSRIVAESLSEDLMLLSQRLNEASDLGEGQVRCAAVKADEPAGKPLKDCQYVMVRLSLFPPDDLGFQRRNALKELKKRMLLRITEEADAQGAPLTYEDLARFLLADRKTIGQYIRELRSNGETVITRATYTDASASTSHHRPIVKQFLLNYTETEIAQRLRHSLSNVEVYIKDFLRVCVAARQGYTVEGIRHLTRLAKGVVEKHLAHYNELMASAHWRQHLEHKLRFYEASVTAPQPKRGAST